MLDFSASAENFVKRAASIEAALDAQLQELGDGFALLGESYAQSKVDQMIYDTPERGYERSGNLRNSIRATIRHEAGGWTITLIADPIGEDDFGAGREYGEQQELGRSLSRVSREEVWKAALALDTPLDLEPFSRQRGGFPNLEPRPFIIPSIAQLRKDLDAEVLRIVRSAANLTV